MTFMACDIGSLSPIGIPKSNQITVFLIKASLFLNGNGSGEGAYVSIYIKILPGEYDALLKWPFSHTVSFTLYDQAANPDKVRHTSIYLIISYE